MLPHKKNKVDISKLTPDEQKAFRMYGKLPAKPVAKVQERKYFDSGDWALSRSGKAEHSNVSTGTSVPKPNEIPHASPAPTPSGTPSSIGTSLPSTSSPPSSGTPLSPGSIAAQNIINMKSSTSGMSGNPISGDALGGPDNAINMSMSPGRVGVGQPLASSPTRSMGLAGAETRTSPTTSSNMGSLGRADSGLGSSHISSTTGNQIGKMQVRRTSQSEGVPNPNAAASPPPSSGLAQSTTREEDSVAEMEL